jgi:hypothetical protein
MNNEKNLGLYFIRGISHFLHIPNELVGVTNVGFIEGEETTTY